MAVLSSKDTYILYTDGGSRGNPGPSACGAVLLNQKGETVWIMGKYLGHSTNNRAEYEGLIRGMVMAKGKGVKQLHIYMDSELAYNQVSGRWKAKDANIKKYLAKIEEVLGYFDHVKFEHTRREGNPLADRIVNIVLDTAENVNS